MGQGHHKTKFIKTLVLHVIGRVNSKNKEAETGAANGQNIKIT